MPMFWGIIIVLIILAAIVHFYLLIIAGLIISFIIVIIMKKRETKLKIEHHIPTYASKIRYYGGYDKELSRKLYCWINSYGICLNDLKTDNFIKINRQDIMGFNTLGEYKVTQKISGGEVSGGGVSIAGAIIGNIIAGPVGAIIGGRKKVKSTPVKTENVVTDTRSVVVYFSEYNSSKKLILEYKVYEDLCIRFPSKNND